MAPQLYRVNCASAGMGRVANRRSLRILVHFNRSGVAADSGAPAGEAERDPISGWVTQVTHFSG
ncbi:hypothetical protein SBA4_2730022 [Candidatus Sulfopaludibacter sp. SbA4]|nr:hypothetical protein SBA4_2730022 [Candidatus Sulfopaludibacter sp. SbA4]